MVCVCVLWWEEEEEDERELTGGRGVEQCGVPLVGSRSCSFWYPQCQAQRSCFTQAPKLKTYTHPQPLRELLLGSAPCGGSGCIVSLAPLMLILIQLSCPSSRLNLCARPFLPPPPGAHPVTEVCYQSPLSLGHPGPPPNRALSLVCVADSSENLSKNRDPRKMPKRTCTQQRCAVSVRSPRWPSNSRPESPLRPAGSGAGSQAL